MDTYTEHGRADPVRGLVREAANSATFRVFMCMAHVKTVGTAITKLSDRSTSMVFFGYEEGAQAYRNCNLETGVVQVSQDMVFEKRWPWNWQNVNVTAAGGSCGSVVITCVTAYRDIVHDNVLQSPPTPAHEAASPDPMTPVVAP